MSHDIEIVSLTREPRDVMRFLKMAYRIYGSDPNWVAPLLMDLKKVFTSVNPLFEHAEMQLWIARRDGQDVGRIAGVLDHHHNRDRAPAENAAFWGFFECVDEPAVARALFDAVTAWAREKHIPRLLGPMNPTSNDECGLLVEGFDRPPVFMMPYNPRYYAPLTEGCGFTKAKDLLAFYIDLAKIPMDRLTRISEKVMKRNPELRLLRVSKKTLDRDLAKVKEVYNAAWEDNWGFVPMTDAELNFMAERLKPLFMEGLVWLAEEGGETIGFLLAMPDYNVALQALRGRLLSPGLFTALPYLLGWKCPPLSRVITLGVKRKHRGRGLETAMLIEGLRAGIRAGFVEAEASWILEDNTMMCRMLETIHGEVYKRYRIYEKAV
jgi:GNAT superfamily N-acetyltransferase